MVFFGGKHFNNPIPGLILFDFKKFKWITMNCSIEPTAGHGALNIFG
jgi:hypothetical protein